MCNSTSNRTEEEASSPQASAPPKEELVQNSKKQQPQRPYPWNCLSDSSWMALGTAILVVIIIPAMSVIALSNIVGMALQKWLYDKNPVARCILDNLRKFQRALFQRIAHVILLDPRNASYLPWMVWGTFVQPAIFVWAYYRYQQAGRLEVSTFLIYHLLRVGPRHQMFAHHATLVHKEGHAYRQGLWRNLFSVKSSVLPYPKTARRWCLDHVNAGIAGILYGTIPNHYATAHNKIHHRWHNDTGDVHTNMDFDRTLFSSYLMYLPRFTAYWTGLSPAMLFWKRNEYGLLLELSCGMIYYYGITFAIWYKAGFVFYWAYMLYPLLEGASFLGMIAYIWHIFSEESDPTNQYVNSITMIRGGNNIWNEDYHVVHHHEPNVHWTDMPQSFYNNIDKYTACRATVFGDCQQGELIYWIFGAKWDDLTDHFIDLQYVFCNGDLNKDRLLTVKEVARLEETPDKVRALHHAEIKDMLLRRLRYHYLGTRKDEWRLFNAKMNRTVRDFDTVLSSSSKNKQS